LIGKTTSYNPLPWKIPTGCGPAADHGAAQSRTHKHARTNTIVVFLDIQWAVGEAYNVSWGLIPHKRWLLFFDK